MMVQIAFVNLSACRDAGMHVRVFWACNAWATCEPYQVQGQGQRQVQGQAVVLARVLVQVLVLAPALAPQPQALQRRKRKQPAIMHCTHMLVPSMSVEGGMVREAFKSSND